MTRLSRGANYFIFSTQVSRGPMAELSEYEQLRLRRIKENEAKLVE